MLSSLFKIFNFGCLHCGKAVPSKKDIFCSHCLDALKRTKTSYANSVLPAVIYDTEQARSLIYYMKQYNDFYVFEFAVSLIADKIAEFDLKDELSDYYITYAPRSPESLFKYRFDQSKEIAQALAWNLFDDDERCVNLFGRSIVSKQQKKLKSHERKINAHEMFYIKRNVFIPPKVIIIDDLTTTGSTLLALRDLLFDAGVRDCFMCSVAVHDIRYVL